MRVTVRPATTADDPFLHELFVAVRGPMFVGLPAEVSGPLLRQQHDAQRRGHAASHPGAEHHVVEVDGRPVGRWSIDRRADAIILVDVAIHPDRQGRGIGALLIERLVAESEKAGLPLRLIVAADNPARRLYERLGFRAQHSGTAYVLMSRDASARHRDETPGISGRTDSDDTGRRR